MMVCGILDSGDLFNCWEQWEEMRFGEDGSQLEGSYNFKECFKDN